MSASPTHAPRAAYVHIPFCVSKCPYCDFNSYPGLEHLYQRYVDAVRAEIHRAAGHGPNPERRPVDSVYLGGGTPTVLSVDQLASIARALRSAFGTEPEAEITVEANPGTVDLPTLARLRASGFNRLSLGVQSLDDGILRALGRIHTARQAVEAFRMARQAGWDSVGIDLMFALPGQDLSRWRLTLEAGIELGPEHVSLYELSIEEGTAFARAPQLLRGNMRIPDDDARLEMYELAIRILTEAGYEHYEVSNFARPGFRSRHNQVYWRNEPYYGFGAGATSYIDGIRSVRSAHPADYIRAILANADAVESWEALDPRAFLGETVALGLRMLEGVDIQRVRGRTGADLTREFSAEIARLGKQGLLELRDGRLRVTHRGLLVLDDVAREFVSSPQAAS